ncbi:MAG: F0F1 ATP synthase subunit gamma, partial [Candidatus Eremiobacteraeota bacterium]|nr:F0F1 ATP synthase subunit gamma [Candidatus Eremiobacteraeota bacterium]
MPSVRDLRDRIRSLKNTQQITKAMKQVAAAKIRRAEVAKQQARPYADTLLEMLRDLMHAVTHVDHPFMNPGKEGAPSGIILMTADKGLAGAFNSNVVRAAEAYARDSGDVRYYTVGTKARNAVRRWGMPDHPTWALGTSGKLETARAVAHRVTEDFNAGTISGITLVSSKMLSMMSQKPEVRKLVPIPPIDSTAGARGAVEFAPSPEFVLSRLLPKYLEFTIFSAMLETDAAFFAAQLIAMNNA